MKNDCLKSDNHQFKISLSNDRKSINFANIGHLKKEIAEVSSFERKGSSNSA